METEQIKPDTKTPPPPTDIKEHVSKNSKEAAKTEYTAANLELIMAVLNARTKGTGIKDLRSIQNVYKKVKAATPERPIQPEAPKKPAEGEPPVSQETKEEYAKLTKEWMKLMTDWPDMIGEIKFTTVDIGIIRQKINAFQGFHSDEESRESVLALCDKLGM